MDKEWIKLKDFTSIDYVNGVKTFMKFAFKNIGSRNKMPCPCGQCLNQISLTPQLVKLHLLTYGMDIDYIEWVHHGESSSQYIDEDIVEGYMDETFEEEEMLKELWEFGVRTRDAKTGEFFRLHAVILWTINDLPTLGDVSGHRTKGYCASPRCSVNTPSQRLRSKIGYIGRRRYLPRYHPYRKSPKFNGKVEIGSRPVELSIDQNQAQLKEVENVVLGKHSSDKKRKRLSRQPCWIKKSILFELPYWSKLKLPHNLDVMNIEKNICDSLIGNLLDIDGKSKDNEKARLDLEDIGTIGMHEWNYIGIEWKQEWNKHGNGVLLI